jgi:pyridoxal phosphate enzyme (YggS family)
VREPEADRRSHEAAALARNVAAVRARIAAAAARKGRDAAAVRLIAVTKSVPAGIAEHLVELGCFALGENRIQDAEPKIAALAARSGVEWHLIGHLQGNKAKRAVALFDWIHAIDGPELLARVDRLAAELGRAPRVLLQLNLSGEASKHGAADEAAIRRLLDAGRAARAVRVVGLMTMAEESDDPETARPIFRKLRTILERERPLHGEHFEELSMGMSGDFEVAVEEGATLVRVGRALFDGVAT